MISYTTVRVWALILFVSLSINCNHSANKASVQTFDAATEQPLVIRTTQSPVGGDSREPELTTTPDGRVILSWVEKLDDKRHALWTALLDRNGWSEARTVAEGENW